MAVAARARRRPGSPDGVVAVGRLERVPGHEHARHSDVVVQGRQRADPLRRAVAVHAHRRKAGHDRRGRHGHRAVVRYLDHHRDVAEVARQPLLVVPEERDPRRGDGEAGAPLDPGGRRRPRIPRLLRRKAALLALQEQRAPFRRLEQWLELLERVHREQLEERHGRPRRHALQRAHELWERRLGIHEVRREQLLELLGRNPTARHVAPVEVDRLVHQVAELPADALTPLDRVALGPDDPKLAHARAAFAISASNTACCAGSCSALSSGCHWTPSIHPRSRSRASTNPSSDQPVADRPSPTPSTP